MSLKEGEYLTSTLPKHWPSDFPLPRSVLQPRSREHARFLGILPRQSSRGDLRLLSALLGPRGVARCRYQVHW